MNNAHVIKKNIPTLLLLGLVFQILFKLLMPLKTPDLASATSESVQHLQSLICAST